jgi:hypothetical protein
MARTRYPLVDRTIDLYGMGIAAYALVAIARALFDPHSMGDQAVYIATVVSVDAMLWPLRLAQAIALQMA